MSVPARLSARPVPLVRRRGRGQPGRPAAVDRSRAGWLALLTGAVLFPRFQRWRYTRRVMRRSTCNCASTSAPTPPTAQPGGSPCPAISPPTRMRPSGWPTRRLEPRPGPPAVDRSAHPPPPRRRPDPRLRCVRRDLAACLPPRRTWRHSRGMTCPRTASTWPPWRAAKFIADLQDEEPHLFVAAGTGAGRPRRCQCRRACTAHGWLVDIIDPKRRSYIDRKTVQDVLTNVPGIRVHTDIEAML